MRNFIGALSVIVAMCAIAEGKDAGAKASKGGALGFQLDKPLPDKARVVGRHGEYTKARLQHEFCSTSLLAYSDAKGVFLITCQSSAKYGRSWDTRLGGRYSNFRSHGSYDRSGRLAVPEKGMYIEYSYGYVYKYESVWWIAERMDAVGKYPLKSSTSAYLAASEVRSRIEDGIKHDASRRRDKEVDF